MRVAVVGLGYWGPNLVRNLHEVDGADAVVVCDARSSAVDTIRRRFPALRGTTRFEDVLADPEVEAVAIATPVSTHFQLAEAALKAGKHVFVEKPLAASSIEAERLLRLASRLGLVLMPGHTFLYSPPVVTIEQMIRSGELGEIYFISTSRVNLGLHQTDVSVVWDLGPHDFSILQYWLGRVALRCLRDEPRLHHSRHPRRDVRESRVPVAGHRPRRALLARAQQAAENDDRRLARR